MATRTKSKKVQVKRSELVLVAEEMNVEMQLKAEDGESPGIDVSLPVGKLREKVIEAAKLIDPEDDAFTERTVGTLAQLGIEAPEKEAKPKTKAKADKPKAKAAKTKKGAAKAATAPTAEGEWREGSSAQIILEAVRSFKNGATSEQVLKKVKDKFESANHEGRVNTVLRVAVQRELVTKEGDKFVAN